MAVPAAGLKSAPNKNSGPTYVENRFSHRAACRRYRQRFGRGRHRAVHYTIPSQCEQFRDDRIGVIAIEKSALQVKRDDEAEKARTLSDDKAADYSRWSMYGTCAVAGIAAFQAILFLWQLKLMRRSTEDATEAARAARMSADVVRDTFTKLERPWIFLEGVRIESREPDRTAPLNMFAPRRPNDFWVSFRFKNNGRTPAHIHGLSVAIVKTDELPDVPDYTRCNAPLNCPASISAEGEFETNRIGPTPGEDVQHTIFGRLTYTDMVGNEHHTAFAIDISQWMPASSTNPNRAYDFHT